MKTRKETKRMRTQDNFFNKCPDVSAEVFVHGLGKVSVLLSIHFPYFRSASSSQKKGSVSFNAW